MKITIKNLNKYYLDENNKQKNILNNLNFELKEGEITLLYGKNGSGKTTLALILAAIIPPNDGEILFDQQSFNNKTKKKQLKDLRKRVKILFQNPDLQLFKRTVAEEIDFSINNYLEKNKQNKIQLTQYQKKIYKVILEKAQFEQSILGKSPHILSTGEKRKLLISCLLISRPEFLILDEPTVGLDNKSKKILLQFLKKISVENKTTILLITHDKGIIENYDNIINIDQINLPKS